MAAPQESADVLNSERYFLSSDFISGVGYGIQAVLYAIAMYYLWRRRNAQRVYTFLLPFLTILFLVSTTTQVAQAHLMELVFVDNKSFPGGPWSYYKQRAVGGVVNLLNVASQLTALILSNLFMIWRCWVIWSSVGRRMAYLVILFPSLMVTFSFITGVFLFITYAHPTSHLALFGGHKLALTTTYYTLRFGTGIVITILILVRLIAFRRRTRAISGNGHGQEYTSIITMIIESSAVYSVIGTACLIASGMGSPLSLLFAYTATAAQQINEYLIIVRLAHGRAWEEDTVTTIHFKTREVNISMSDSQIDLDSERMAGGKPEDGVSGHIVYFR